MILVRILQRRDAASLVVAIAAGLAVAQFVAAVMSPLSAMLSGMDRVGGFREDYWQPLLFFILQLVALEVLARVAILIRSQLVSRRPR
jgi:hypothetical protein